MIKSKACYSQKLVIKLFTQPVCPKCPVAKQLVLSIKKQVLRIKIEEYDVTTVDGMAEASFYTVMATPTILIFDDNGKIIKDFRGEAPALKEVLPFIE